MAIKIVVDSTAGIEKGFAIEHGITVVSLNILFSDEVFSEGYPGEYDRFYDKLERSKEFPKTSLPSPQLFSKVFSDLIDEGNEVICITLSSSLSGTYNSARTAAQEYADKVSVIDSQACCQAILFFVEEALDMIAAGKSRQEIVNYIETNKNKVFMQFLPYNLDYLMSGGRINLLAGSIGNLLHIKPLLLFRNGKLTNNKKVLGMNKAVSELVNLITENIKKIYVVCIGKSEYFEMLKVKVAAALGKIAVRFGEISPVMGTHVGPGSLGIACMTF